MSLVASFTIEYTRYLDPQGAPAATLPDFALDPAALIRLYRAMVLTRAFDRKAIALQRTGRLGTYASSLGQEAVAVGVADPMQRDDVFLPSFRELGGQIVRGVGLTELFLNWGGDERGSDFAAASEDFPISVPVGSHAPHAVGVALAFKLRGEARVAVCVFGDGATSKGDVYEALNLAGARALPVVFVINNNQWAISMPRSAQTGARTLAQKAIAAGIDAEQVDGNDVIAVRHAVASALDNARSGGGPHVIEALTYRLGDHTTADDASRYRDDAEVSAHWREDPIARLRSYLADTGAWGMEDEGACLQESDRAVESAAAAYLEMPPQSPEAIFEYLYRTLPAPLAEQRNAMLGQMGEP